MKNNRIALPQQTVWTIVRRCLYFKLKRNKNQKSTSEEDVHRLEFCINVQEALEDDYFSAMLIFSNYAVFYLSADTNHHNELFWSSKMHVPL